VWAVPLRFTDSDFPFGIFKYFFYEMYDSAVGIKGHINNKSLLSLAITYNAIGFILLVKCDLRFDRLVE
jgi:hypothetical protein